MTGKSDEKVLSERKNALTAIQSIYPENEIDLIDNFIADFKGDYIERVGETVKLLSQADIVIFTEDWALSKGCRIEHFVCQECEVPFFVINNLSNQGE